MPILFVGVITVPVLLSTMDNDEKFNVALIAHTGKYAPLLKDTGKISLRNSAAKTVLIRQL